MHIADMAVSDGEIDIEEDVAPPSLNLKPVHRGLTPSRSMPWGMAPLSPQPTAFQPDPDREQNKLRGVRYVMHEQDNTPYIMLVKKIGSRVITGYVGGKIIAHSRQGNRIVRNSTGNMILKIAFDQTDSDLSTLLLSDFRTGLSYSIRRKGEWKGFGQGQVVVVPRQGGDREPVVRIYANVLRSHATIYDTVNARRICEISRTSCGVPKFVSGLDSYCVDVGKGADVLLMIMLAVGFHELYVKPSE